MEKPKRTITLLPWKQKSTNTHEAVFDCEVWLEDTFWHFKVNGRVFKCHRYIETLVQAQIACEEKLKLEIEDILEKFEDYAVDFCHRDKITKCRSKEGDSLDALRNLFGMK